MKRNFNIFGMQNSLRGKIYKKNVRIKTVVLISVAVLLICIMITVGIFFWFRQYIVYTSDGLYLDVPWLRDAAEAAASAETSLPVISPPAFPPLALEDDDMERITHKTPSGYTAASAEAAIERLGRLEDMYDDLKREYDLAAAKMESTPDSRKGSASYRQLFSNKLTLGLILGKFDIYLD